MQGYDNSAAKKTFFSIVAVITLIMAVAGGTFAYFAASATNAGTVRGTAATAELGLTVTQVEGIGDPMVPLLDSALPKALAGTGGVDSCIDANSNVSCKVYKADLVNNGSSSVALSSTLTLSNAASSDFSNLSYVQLESATTIGKFADTMQKVDMGTAYDFVLDDGGHDSNNKTLLIEASGTKTYYFVVWISETGSDQTTTDYGSFTGTLSFVTSGGDGVTSAFNS